MKYKSETLLFVIIVIVLLSLCNSAFAQPGPPRGSRMTSMPPSDEFPPPPNQLEINKYMDYLETILNLDCEQKVRLKSVFEDHYRKIDNLRPGNTRIYDDMRERYNELLSELEAKVSVVLNGEQQKAYDEFLDEQEARMGGREYIQEGFIPPLTEDDNAIENEGN